MISSLQNATVRKISRLHKPIRREQEQAFLVEGHQAVSVALAARAPLFDVLHTPAAARRRASLLKEAAGAGARVLEVSVPVMEHITGQSHPADVCATAPLRRCQPEALSRGDLVVVLCGVRDPSVAGSIMAAAAAAGATGIAATPGTADLFSAPCARAAAGAHFVLNVATRVDPAALAAGLGDRRVVALDEVGADPGSGRLQRPLAVVIGGTPEPLPDAFASAERVAVPAGETGVRAGLSARAAVVLYEVGRTRS